MSYKAHNVWRIPLQPAKFILCLSMIILWLTTAAFAQNLTKIRLMVLPFEVNAAPELEYLREGLPKLLVQSLREQGFIVQDLQETSKIIEEQQVKYLDLTTVKDLALLGNAQYAVYGTFSQVGETISIDARLVEAFGLKTPRALFVVKKGTINILPAIEELATKIKLELLKKERIAEIEVKGTKILDKDVVLLRLKIQKGDIFDPKQINAELKRLFELGYFDDVQFKVDDLPEGKKITIIVKEKPLIKAISIIGTDAINEDDILEVMSTKTGSVLNPKILAEDLNKVRELYRKKGYYQAKVSYELEQTEPAQARLNIKIKEGKKLYIKKIRIEGAKQLDPDDLKDELALAERGLFSWLTGSGVLKEELLERDAAALEAYYGNRGFFDARVGQPVVEFKDDGIYITFKVIEGQRYKVGKIDFKGDIIVPENKLFSIIKLDDLAREDEYFDRSVMRHDLQALADFYTDFGYAFAESDVKLDKDEKNKKINVTYILNKGQKIFIRRVTIEGNTKTRDNVIRREMRLSDGDLFSGSALRRSNVRLNKLDYFETVDIETVPTDRPDQLDLRVKVKEKPTGMLSLGAGYSSLDKFFVAGQIQERNLFGKGYVLGLKGTFSGRRTSYDFSFWDPHLNDSKLGIGADLYLIDEEFFDYDKESSGGKIKFAYPLGEYTRLYWNYRLEKYIINNVSDAADEDIKDLKGENWASAIYIAATRDTTDKRLNPSRGTINTLSIENAGGIIGGDDNYIKYTYDFSFYHPIFKKPVFHWHVRLGYVMPNSNDPIPSFERFYVGGMNSVRGYPGREIAPKYDNGDYKGGDKEFFTNYELLYPLNKEIGLIGLVFFDAGNAWDEDEFKFEVYRSVGAGIRWYSPLGPLRLEYGYGLDKLYGEKYSKLEFSVGQFF
ncbi:outer membrane protein assembly factor BamA [Desulfovulcanus sp.]